MRGTIVPANYTSGVHHLTSPALRGLNSNTTMPLPRSFDDDAAKLKEAADTRLIKGIVLIVLCFQNSGYVHLHINRVTP